MSDDNEQKPVGYGHDKKGVAGGVTKNEGRVHVAHKAPMSGAADAGKSTAKTFTIDDRDIDIRDGETIFRAARRLGIKLPHLCYLPKPGYRPDGNCRVCMVEIEGERVLAASCIRMPAPGMKVRTQTDRAKTARRMVAELLLTDQPAREVAHDPDSELWKIATRLNIQQGRFPRHATPAPDRSHPAMAVNLDACIQCNLCVRACREVQVNDVIGMAGRGHGEKIVFDFDDPMGASTCVACGECVQACPTGALMPATLVDERNVFTAKADRSVDSVCPYCGVGCQLTYHIKDDKLLYVTGKDGPANENRLCVKGRFGFDYVHNPQRLLKPMIRKDGVPKIPHEQIDPSNPWTHFREASWEEALDRAAAGLKKIRDRDGSKALAGFGSAKGSNEEAYLFQKLVRTGFGTNNVDHCTRLCHASSVAALMEGIGSGAVSATFNECKNSEVIFVIGANPTENHPVAATFFKQAAKRGATMIVADPRGQALKRHATHMLQFKPGTDVALLNGMLNTIVAEKLYDEQYIQTYVEGFKQFAESIKDYTPEEMAPICGVEADIIRTVARKFARAKAAIIFWGMGISQHTHGTDNARCLIALSLITGQIGRPGTGLHPLRGQNNVQGASDAGLIPMFFPDYKSVEDPQIRARVEAAWGAKLDPKKGLTVVEIMDAVHADVIKGMYIMGENPAMSDPDLNHAREALGPSRTSRRAGSVPHRDRGLCRRRAAGLGLAGKGRHGHQYQSPGADGPPSTAAAGRCAARLVAHSGNWPPYRSAMELPGPRRTLRRDGVADAIARQHLLGTRAARERGHLSGRRTGRARPRCGVRQGFPAAWRIRQARCGKTAAAGRNAERGISVHPHHRSPARTLAYRGHDPPRDDARCLGAERGSLGIARHYRKARH